MRGLIAGGGFAEEVGEIEQGVLEEDGGGVAAAVEEDGEGGVVFREDDHEGGLVVVIALGDDQFEATVILARPAHAVLTGVAKGLGAPALLDGGFAEEAGAVGGEATGEFALEPGGEVAGGSAQAVGGGKRTERGVGGRERIPDAVGIGEVANGFIGTGCGGGSVEAGVFEAKGVKQLGFEEGGVGGGEGVTGGEEVIGGNGREVGGGGGAGFAIAEGNAGLGKHGDLGKGGEKVGNGVVRGGNEAVFVIGDAGGHFEELAEGGVVGSLRVGELEIIPSSASGFIEVNSMIVRKAREEKGVQGLRDSADGETGIGCNRRAGSGIAGGGGPNAEAFEEENVAGLDERGGEAGDVGLAAGVAKVVAEGGDLGRGQRDRGIRG